VVEQPIRNRALNARKRTLTISNAINWMTRFDVLTRFPSLVEFGSVDGSSESSNLSALSLEVRTTAVTAKRSDLTAAELGSPTYLR
jgi:hypothetical protein